MYSNNSLRRYTLLLLATFGLFACSTDDAKSDLQKSIVVVDDRSLTTYVSGESKEYLVIFESGLGDDARTWQEKNIVAEICELADVVLYDRAGYRKSEAGTADRNIPNLTQDLQNVIAQHRNGRKIILVGHSLGGWIIRDYAIKNPAEIAGLLFIDTAHEHYNDSTTSQDVEDLVYNAFKSQYGEAFGGTLEARQLLEDIAYAATMDQLPDVPVVVLTSMKTDSQHSLADRQHAYNAQRELGTGISNFTQVKVDAGHYIQSARPDLVIQYLKNWTE